MLSHHSCVEPLSSADLSLKLALTENKNGPWLHATQITCRAGEVAANDSGAEGKV